MARTTSAFTIRTATKRTGSGGGGGGGGAHWFRHGTIRYRHHPSTHHFTPPLPTARLRFSTAVSDLKLDDDDDVDDSLDWKDEFKRKEPQPLPTITTTTTTTTTTSSPFRVTAPFAPTGDQPRAIEEIVQQLQHHNSNSKNNNNSNNNNDDKDGDETATTSATAAFCILQGATGTGKTLVMSHVLARLGRPTLVLCHNKTLAAQVARELQSYLSSSSSSTSSSSSSSQDDQDHHDNDDDNNNNNNSSSSSSTQPPVVTLFVSHYDYFVPESYVEATGTYIAKKSSANAELDALRHQATRALMLAQQQNGQYPVVVVASVSCIYGLGLPKDYLEASRWIQTGEQATVTSWQAWVQQLEDTLLYTLNQNDNEFARGHYQVATSLTTGNALRRVMTLWEPHESYPMTMEWIQQPSLEEDDRWVVQSIHRGGPRGVTPVDAWRIFPAKHHATPPDRLEQACVAIEEELRDRYKELIAEGKHEEAARLHKRVINDLEALRERGYCAGTENYSRHLARRNAGEPPDTLMDYFGMNGQEWLLIVDESHVTLPQLKAMYHGDQARKRNLVKHGFRLPSALDNRPLREEEFWKQVKKALFVSATPAKQELSLTKRPPVEMMIRPTWVCDPVIDVRPPDGQLEDLLQEITRRAEKGQRTLAVALTKRDAEDLASFLIENKVKSTYIHSDLSTTERADALRALQTGEVDCLVGVNLLREGLDLPQVSLVAVLNADANGFLRSATALLQIVGRAARNIDGTAIFYAKSITHNMQMCMDATARRRSIQLAYNDEHGREMRTTEGSSTLSIFDIYRDRINAERELEIVDHAGMISSERAPATSRLSTNSIQVHARSAAQIETDHIPSSPGVYFWKDENGRILYIGKAAKLRSRVRSYLAPSAKHCRRIESMLRQAASVEFFLTPSERDALVLESNLIKHHQPPFNVLLKDDSHYPYICASIGDAFPQFSIVPRREDSGALNRRYRYFGPYTSFKEINRILEGIEEQYNLRSQSFLARYGPGSREEYHILFNKALEEVFGRTNNTLRAMRAEYEEAGQLFDSKHNRCCDVVTVTTSDANTSATVHIIQLRNGLIAGRFSYACDVPFGLNNDEDFSAVIQAVLVRQHYPSCEESLDEEFPWFPDEILLPHPAQDEKEIHSVLQEARIDAGASRRKKLAIRLPVTSGSRQLADAKAMQLARENAQQASREKARTDSSAISSEDWKAATELTNMLSLEKVPKRIECFDISHTQGDFAVGSRVVFINGEPARDLYRRFNVKSVEGVDDYASLTEILERRFRRAWVNGIGGPIEQEDHPWALPDVVVIDGGPGQLSAALKGMSNAQVFPHGSKSKDRSGQNRGATVAVCALAKRNEEVYVPGRQDPVNDSPDSPGLLLLRALRDESHRFALYSHRKRRSIAKMRSNH